MVIPVPTLSSAGWVTASADKADKVMAHAFEAMKSQTFLYGKNVTSIQDLIEKYGHNPSAMTQELRTAFEIYLRRYYTGVIVDVNISDDGTPRYEIRLFIQVTEEGKQYSFGRLLQITDGNIIKIMQINNG